MSLFPSTLTGRILDDGVTAPPVIELQGISAGQLSLVLTQYTPLETSTQHTADIGTNAAAIAALQSQVAALPAAPDLTPYALAADLAAAEGLVAANASGLTAVNTSLTLGLASKANQSALDALQVQVDGNSTPASVDLNLANHPTTAAMNSSIASTNNATLATVAATYALKSVVDQLAIDVAARQTAADVDQRVATALLSYLTQTAYQAGQALQDARLDGHDTEILALQNAGPFATAGDLNTLQLTLQSELDSQLTATFTQYWTSSRTQTEIDDAIAGAGFLTQALADARYFAVSANGSFESLVRTNVTPPQIKALLPRAPLAASTILADTTLELTCDAFSKAESDGRYLSSSNFAPLDARYFPRNPAVAEGNGLFHLVQEQFTPKFIRSLLFRPPLTGGAILGNGSVIEIEADCWSKAQSNSRYPLITTFNSLGSTVTSIDGRVTALENAPGVAPTADLTVNSLTATSFVQTPLAAERRGGLADQERHHDPSRRRRHAAGQLRRRQHRAGAGHHRPVGPDPQRHHGGLRPVLRGLHGGHRGLHEQQLHHRHAADRERPAGAGAAAALRSGGQRADRHRRDPGRAGGRHPAGERGDSSGSEPALPEPDGGQQRRAGAEPPAGANRRGAQQFRGHRGAQRRGHGRRDADPGQQRAERAGGAQGARRRRRADEHSLPVHELQHHQRPRQPGDRTEHRRQQQRGADLRLRLREPLGQGTQDERPGPLGEGAPGDLRCRGAPNVRPHRGGQGPFIAQEVQATPLGERVCKTKNLDGRALMTLDYQKLNVVLWGVVKSLQKRVEKLEKKKRGRS